MASRGLWTIDELEENVARALARGYQGPANGQVRAVPDRRTIRYYTTLGLLDRPAEMRGRTALYGRRHLLQMVAIKKLQAEGASLADVQTELGGKSDKALAAIADLDLGALAAPPPSAASERAGSFWQDLPVEAGEPAAAVAPPLQSPAPVSIGLPIAPGCTLLFTPARPLEDQDHRAVRAAAAELVHTLQILGLLRPSTDQEGE